MLINMFSNHLKTMNPKWLRWPRRTIAQCASSAVITRVVSIMALWHAPLVRLSFAAMLFNLQSVSIFLFSSSRLFHSRRKFAVWKDEVHVSCPMICVGSVNNVDWNVVLPRECEKIILSVKKKNNGDGNDLWIVCITQLCLCLQKKSLHHLYHFLHLHR